MDTNYYSATVHGSYWKTKENKVCCLVHGAARYPPLCDPFGRYSLKISTLTAVTLTMRTAIKNCHKTHRVLIMHRYTIFWLQNVPNVNRYETKLLFFEDWTRTVSLTNLRHAMMHRYTKFDCKRLRTSDYFLRIWLILSPHCDLELEDRNPAFSYDTLSHADAPTYQVSLRKVKFFRRYCPDK